MNQGLSHVFLVSDMDDTLLRKDKKISAADLDAIRKFRSLGGQFTVATGRSIPSYEPYHDVLGLSNPVVLNNGAVVYDPLEKRILWNSVLPKEAGSYVSDMMEQFPFIGAEILTERDLYVLRMNEQVKMHMEVEHLHCIPADMQDLPDVWFKALFALPPDRMEEVRAYVSSRRDDRVEYTISSKHYCEMLPLDTSKGSALRVLLELKQYQQKKVYAIGDYFNDIAMIQTADIGAAMGHAPDGVKQYADWIAPEQDALSYMVQRIIENELA